MITRRGWLLVASGAAMFIAGRLLGLEELYVLGAAAILGVACALAYVRLSSVEVSASRLLRPQRVHIGAPCRVDLRVLNTGRGRTPPLTADDPFDNGRLTAGFDVPRLDSGEAGRAAYRVPTDRRGRFVLGPLRLLLEDPFGLAANRMTVAGTTTVTVYPRIERLAPLPPTPGYDPNTGALQQGGRLQGEDFYALRPYQVGDDLRQVHWPSTAKADDLMIRQMELPWQQRATVLLDLRRNVHTAASLEMAVSAAASLLTASWRAGALIRLVTTTGVDSSFGTGPTHWEALLSTLAGVSASSSGALAPTIGRLRRRDLGGAVAVVTTSAAAAVDLAAVTRLRDRAGLVALVVFERSAYDPGAPEEDRPVPARLSQRIHLVRVTRHRPLTTAWSGVGRHPVTAR
jgi:uncharacterized protein (DUF58 family)